MYKLYSSLPELEQRKTWAEIRFAFYGGGGLAGKFWVWTGGANLLQSAASRLIGGWDAFPICEKTDWQRKFFDFLSTKSAKSCIIYV